MQARIRRGCKPRAAGSFWGSRRGCCVHVRKIALCNRSFPASDMGFRVTRAGIASAQVGARYPGARASAAGASMRMTWASRGRKDGAPGLLQAPRPGPRRGLRRDRGCGRGCPSGIRRYGSSSARAMRANAMGIIAVAATAVTAPPAGGPPPGGSRSGPGPGGPAWTMRAG